MYVKTTCSHCSADLEFATDGIARYCPYCGCELEYHGIANHPVIKPETTEKTLESDTGTSDQTAASDWEKEGEFAVIHFGELKIFAPPEFDFRPDYTERDETRMYIERNVILDVERIRFDELHSEEIKNRLKNGSLFREEYRKLQSNRLNGQVYRYGNLSPKTFSVHTYYLTEDSYYHFSLKCSQREIYKYSNKMIKMITWTEVDGENSKA